MASKTKATLLKGVYNLNPTRMIMKSGGMMSRLAVTSDVPGFKKKGPVKSQWVKVNKGTKR